jgi:hypothetical protein
MTDQSNARGLDIKRRDFLAVTATGTALAGLGALTTASPALAATDTAAANPLAIATSEINFAALPRVKQVMVAPPFAPDHEKVASTGPKIVEVEMTIVEKKVKIDHDGTTIWAFTYENTVPGPLIICHQGDYVELTLKSHPDNMLEHNIDFHAATGALGGAALTYVRPGEQVKLRFRALKAGTFTPPYSPGCWCGVLFAGWARPSAPFSPATHGKPQDESGCCPATVSMERSPRSRRDFSTATHADGPPVGVSQAGWCRRLTRATDRPSAAP